MSTLFLIHEQLWNLRCIYWYTNLKTKKAGRERKRAGAAGREKEEGAEVRGEGREEREGGGGREGGKGQG